jgi:hypothetical protein
MDLNPIDDPRPEDLSLLIQLGHQGFLIREY